MRDFRDAKAMAQTLRRAPAAKGLKISNSDSLELIAQALGVRDWNTLSAMIRVEPAPPREDPAPPDEPPSTRFTTFSRKLEETLHRAVDLANQRGHRDVTPEHLLLALADDRDAASVLRACAVDIDLLRTGLVAWLDSEATSIHGDDGGPPDPTPAFQRIIQRAVIQVHASGRDVVIGANVLGALFSETDSHAVKLLLEQGMTRQDAVNFIDSGVGKGGGDAAA